MTIRKTTLADADRVSEIFDEARETIAALGIDQWQNGYPSREAVLDDIEKGQAFCVEADGNIVATFALLFKGEPTYDKIYDGEWISGDGKDYVAMHRVAVSVACRGKGVSTAIVDFATDMTRQAGRGFLRIDTHRGNVVMRRMLEKHGFEYCGIIYLKSGEERVAYEKRALK